MREASRKVNELAWSRQMCHAEIEISEDGKTATRTTTNGHVNVLMALPVTYGKNVWKIKLDQFTGHDALGVCGPIENYAQYMNCGNLGFEYCSFW